MSSGYVRHTSSSGSGGGGNNLSYDHEIEARSVEIEMLERQIAANRSAAMTLRDHAPSAPPTPLGGADLGTFDSLDDLPVAAPAAPPPGGALATALSAPGHGQGRPRGHRATVTESAYYAAEQAHRAEQEENDAQVARDMYNRDLRHARSAYLRDRQLRAAQSYAKSKTYTPWFCRIVMFACTVMLVVSIGMNCDCQEQGTDAGDGSGSGGGGGGGGGSSSSQSTTGHAVCGADATPPLPCWRLEPWKENPTFGPNTATLLKLGAKKGDLIVGAGTCGDPTLKSEAECKSAGNMWTQRPAEWWRLLTPMWLHAGILHWLFNMFGLYQVGFGLEREFGWKRIGPLYFFSGLFSAIFSTMLVPTTVGVGASGAIFGLFGASWSDLAVNWSLYKGVRCKVFTQLFICTAINLGLGIVPMLDNFAHVGGFLCGFVCGFAFLVQTRVDGLGEEKQRKTYQNVLQLLAAVTFPCMILTAFLVLYLGIDVTKQYPWLRHISCVPFPPGDPANYWWDCGRCSTEAATVTAQYFYNNTMQWVELACPGGAEATVYNGRSVGLAGELISFNTPIDSAGLLEVCKQACVDG